MSNVNIFDNQIKLKDVEDLLLLGMNINLPVFMLSGPGRGKSSIVKQFADKYFNGKMQTLILSRIESSDLALPIPTKNEDGTYSTHFAISEFLPKEPCVLFLDEFSQANSSVQCIVQQLLLEGSFMHYKLPKGTYIVLAGNRTQDNANSGEVLSTIANRCIMCEIKEDEQEFLDYAEEQNLHPVVIDYVRRYPGNLFGLQDEEGHPCFTTPRSMERTSEIMYQYDKGVVSESVLATAIEGTLGKNVYSKIKVSMEMVNDLPRPQYVLEGKAQPLKLDKVGLAGVHTLVTGCRVLLKNKLQDDLEAGLVYSGNFLNYLADNIINEQELLCSVANNLVNMAAELNVPFVKIIIAAKPAYVRMMDANIQFESSIQKLLAN
ncbi:ATPase [Aeromonas phage phiA047]|nr:ATPase [Aeromonas phage phiA047]